MASVNGGSRVILPRAVCYTGTIFVQSDDRFSLFATHERLTDSVSNNDQQ